MLAGIILGHDPDTLHEQVDLAAVGRRLTELGALRSLSALNERAELLLLVERLDDAWDTAQAALRLARFTGDRQDLLDARIRKARVAHARGKSEAAATDLSGCLDEATANEWTPLAARAVSARGRIAFDLGDYDRALADFTTAVSLLQHAGVQGGELDTALAAAATAEAYAAGKGAHPAGPPPAPTGEPA